MLTLSCRKEPLKLFPLLGRITELIPDLTNSNWLKCFVHNNWGGLGWRFKTILYQLLAGRIQLSCRINSKLLP